MQSSASAAYEILVDKDVEVPMRDGSRLKADVLRPADGGKFPAILNLGPYQKDKLWIPPDNLEEKPNPLMNWETVNPQWWVPKGYAAVRVDGRGGARARSGSAESPISRSTSGSSPVISRPHCGQSFPGKASPISTATRCF